MDVISLTSVGPVGETLKDAGIEVTALEMRAGRPSPVALIRLARQLQQRRPHILQCWMYHADLLGGLAALTVPSVRAFWNLRQTNLDPRHSKRLTRTTAALCARLSHWLPHTIICGSVAARDIHIALGYDPGKMQIIENGVDTVRFAPSPQAAIALRRELGLPPDRRLVGLVARFHPQKDHRTFFEMARIVRDRHSNTSFVLCGEDVVAENAVLNDWIKELDLEDDVHLLGQRRDMEKVIAAFDVSVSSSASAEGGANVLLESLAAGIPCIATDVGDAKRIVGDAGTVVPAGAPETLATSVLDILALPNAQPLRDVARHRALTTFDIKIAVRRYETHYVTAATRESNQSL